MSHPNEQELILHYYSEAEETDSMERHLAECDACRVTYESLRRTLDAVEAPPVPEPGREYEAELWRRIEPGLRPLRQRGVWMWQWRWAAAAGVAALLVVAFVAGRHYPKPAGPASGISETSLRDRILAVAVGDYLERSQRVLVELVNGASESRSDISGEQERSADLLTESRLYRQTALESGDASVVSVLDELERALLDVAHAPSRPSAEQLEGLRRRLEGEGILFKIRVLGSNVRSQEESSSERNSEVQRRL